MVLTTGELAYTIFPIFSSLKDNFHAYWKHLMIGWIVSHWPSLPSAPTFTLTYVLLLVILTTNLTHLFIRLARVRYWVIVVDQTMTWPSCAFATIFANMSLQNILKHRNSQATLHISWLSLPRHFKVSSKRCHTRSRKLSLAKPLPHLHEVPYLVRGTQILPES